MEFFWGLGFILSLTLATATGDISDDHGLQTFIVRVQNDLKPSVYSDVEHWYSSTLRSLSYNPYKLETESRGDFLHVYKTVFHGFSARLTPQQAAELKEKPGVLGLFPDQVRYVQTTRSPKFLGLTAANPTGLLTESDYGANVIIGVLDTGIFPERRSFSDDGLGPVPTRWKGECEEGEKFAKTLCNKKVIGARYFTAGYDASVGLNQTTDLKSAIDSEGHGTHTASTAAGRQVGNASFLGFADGIAAGMAPKARIAAYKVCWSRGCLNSDILAGFDKAVADGVDVISLSVGGGSVPYDQDPIALGSFAAMEKGVLVSASAGNEGPMERTLSNVAPWITTVGASTIDRSFPADLFLGDGTVITGASLYKGASLPEKTYLPLIYGANASVGSASFSGATCVVDSLDPRLVRGKIVLCDRGGSTRASKGIAVRKAGGVGVVIANVAPLGEGLVADAHLIPGVGITESAGYKVKSYLQSTKKPQATMVFRGTQVEVKPAPVVASFSSRGPNPETYYVLKPDLIAPGVNILAAWPKGVSPTNLAADNRITEFNIISGTSMSCPHVSGLAALLKGAHPDWSPAMIKSAMMTTAYRIDNRGKLLLDEKTYNASTVWDIGAGHVDPEKATNPGLVYDLTVDDYVKFLCATGYTDRSLRTIARRSVNCQAKPRNAWDLNYPAISAVFNLSGRHARHAYKLSARVTRTVTNVGDGPSTYEVKVTNPKGAIVTVHPSKLALKTKGEKQSYVVQVTASKVEVPTGNVLTESGTLTWTDGEHSVTSPIVVVWQNP